MCEREGLDEKAFEEGTFAFADVVIGRNCPVMWSMTKARKMGWTGHQDSCVLGAREGEEKVEVVRRWSPSPT